MTEKERYLEEQISQKTQFWVRTMLVLGIVLFPFIGIADYFVTPVNFLTFLKYRFIITVMFIIFYFLNRLKRSKNYQYALIYIIIVLSAVTIEMMILSFGGHASPYYAGLNLLIIAALGLIPFSSVLSISASLSIYAIYLIPIIVFDRITDSKVFIANNIFMISTYAIGLTWRILSQKTMLNELSLQYDLEQQKRELERYSTQLEVLVTERTLELNKSEQWHRSLFENATDGIVVLDRNGIIVNANEKACDMHGFDKKTLVGTHIKLLEDKTCAEDAAVRMRRIRAGESLVYETAHNRRDGTSFFLEISCKAIEIGDELFVQSFYRDITEKKKIQEHLLQSQKMESIGVLAGGIAHDFNNILTAILGHAEIIRLSSTLSDRSHKSLQVIEDISRRAGGMISKLLGFARKSDYNLSVLNLNDVVGETVKLLERVIDKRITLRVELESRLPAVKGDINQLEQVIMNLIVNARDAMPDGGRLVVTTADREVFKGMPDMPPYILPGKYVQLTVTDTGSGIPELLRNRIFEPFFTTKERGKGTGLGLSMVYGAVKEHGGYITVQSDLGQGSVFTVYLPASREAARPGCGGETVTLAGNETLLIVDDQKDILDLMRDTLVRHGYLVLATSDPAQALKLFHESHREIALVIVDMIMPRIDGHKLIGQLKTVNPATKILAVSGYTKYVTGKEEIGEDIAGFLRKPLDSRHLLAEVRRILDTRPDTALFV